MLDPLERTRFQELRRREDEGALTPEEQDELSLLIQKIEDAEAVYLGPANERLARECEAIQARNQALKALMKRKETLVARLEQILAEAAKRAHRPDAAIGLGDRLERMLAEAEAERQAIDEELSRLLGEPSPAGTVSFV